MSMNVRKCWEGNPCPSGQTCHSSGDAMAGQGICIPDSPHSIPTHLTISYDCNNGNCTLRYDNNGTYQSKAECEAQCAKGTLNMAWGCAKGHKPGARCTKVPGFANGKTLFADEASCEKSTTCGSVPATLNMAWKCAEGHKPGARCVQVPGFANGKTLFADEASCENNTTCGAVPVKLLTEPDWAIGVSEGNPLEMISTANVGNIHNAVINYM